MQRQKNSHGIMRGATFGLMLLFVGTLPAHASVVQTPWDFALPTQTFTFDNLFADLGVEPPAASPWQYLLQGPQDFGDFTIRLQNGSGFDSDMFYQGGTDLGCYVGCLANRTDGGVFWTIVFDQPVNSFGLSIDAPVTENSFFAVYAEDQTLDFFTTAERLAFVTRPDWGGYPLPGWDAFPIPELPFIGWESPTQSFTKVIFRLNGPPQQAQIDNLIYSAAAVPVPGTLALLLLGIGGITWTLCRRGRMAASGRENPVVRSV